MHMFSDPHTFLIAIFGHIQNSTNHFATFSFLFHALPEEGVGGQFSIYIYIGCSSTLDSIFMCSLQTCITLKKEFTKPNPL